MQKIDIPLEIRIIKTLKDRDSDPTITGLTQ